LCTGKLKECAEVVLSTNSLDSGVVQVRTPLSRVQMPAKEAEKGLLAFVERHLVRKDGAR